MACKRTLVATTDKQVFTSAQSRDQQAGWPELADTALHNAATTVVVSYLSPNLNIFRSNDDGHLTPGRG
jgi:hypothetical protein